MHDHHWDLGTNANWTGQTVTKQKKLGNWGRAQRCPFIFFCKLIRFSCFVYFWLGVWQSEKGKNYRRNVMTTCHLNRAGCSSPLGVTENLGLPLKHIESISIILRDPLQQSDPGQHGEGPAGICNANQRWRFGQRKEKKIQNGVV